MEILRNKEYNFGNVIITKLEINYEKIIDEIVKVSIKIEYTKTELPGTDSKTLLLIVIKSSCLILFFVGWGACGG